MASKLTTHDLARLLGGTHVGETNEVRGLAPPDKPSPGCVVIVGDRESARRLAQEPLAALIVPEKIEGTPARSLIRVADTRLALARLTQIFDDRPQQAEGVHLSAVIHNSAVLSPGVGVAPGVVVGANVRIGPGCKLGSGSVLGPGVTLGAECRLHANVTLYDGVQLGNRVILHSGVVVGSDGFGYASGPRGAVKIHHLGTVVIGDDVEIGANTAVDRGTLGATRIGDRTKIDNLCQIGHNVIIGSDCLIAGKAGIAGSSRIGDRVILGGDVVVTDHVTIGSDCRIAGRSGIAKNVPAGETWAGSPAQPYRQFLRRHYLIGRLERIWSFVRSQQRGD